jgi:hypothetical protein
MRFIISNFREIKSARGNGISNKYRAVRKNKVPQYLAHVESKIKNQVSGDRMRSIQFKDTALDEALRQKYAQHAYNERVDRASDGSRGLSIAEDFLNVSFSFLS